MAQRVHGQHFGQGYSGWGRATPSSGIAPSYIIGSPFVVPQVGQLSAMPQPGE
jgi:hypothetical protein